MSIKITTEVFKQRVYNRYGDEYVVLDEYKSAKEKLHIKHNICKRIIYVTPDSFLSKQRNGSSCRFCGIEKRGNDRRKTTEQYKKEIYDKYGAEYTILGKYTGSHEKILIRHNKCKREYKVQANSLLAGYQCNDCQRKRISLQQRKTNEIFKEEVKQATNNEYIVLGNYVNALTPILMKHNIKNCGYEWNVTPNSILSKSSRCPMCAGNIKFTQEKFIDMVKKYSNNEYEVLEKYINIDTKILMKHKKCNFEWEITPYKFLYRQQRCPKCSRSKGEMIIENVLNNNVINYKIQYKFVDCKNKNCLPFDFAIFKNKECTKLKYLIEYDGQQHFEPINFGGISDELAYENFIKTINNDIIKNTYCRNNNIKLIRIPYYQFNDIEEILNNINN